MQRWNGWGDDAISLDLPLRAIQHLQEIIGEGTPREDYPLDEMVRRIPPSRLPDHPLITADPRQRIIHAHGQSLPDWIGLRGGTMLSFPDGVAVPGSTGDIQELLDFAFKHKIIVIPWGGGTSVVGHLTIPEGKRPVLSLSLKHLNRMTNFDPYNRLATFEAGVKGPDLEAQLRAKDFTLGHFPQSFEYSSLGGWIVTRAVGQESTYYGRMDQLFAGGTMLTPKGPITFPPFPASAAGPDLRHLLLGSEGRLGVLTTATVKISPLPERHDIHGVFFPSWKNAVEAVRIIAGTGLPLSMARLSNPEETMINLLLAGHETHIALLKRYLKFREIPEAEGCMCLIGFIGSRRIVSAVRRESSDIIGDYDGVFIGKTMGESWKKQRFRGPYLRNTLWDMGYAVDTIETAVSWDRVTATMHAVENAVRSSLEPVGERVHVFTHLSSVYTTGSSVYTTCVFRLGETPEDTLTRWRTIKEVASDTIVAAGGTISHQHGVGTDHKPYLKPEKGEIGMDIIRRTYLDIDPDERMNPGKLV
ncbi:MAG: FAD-binding oxidoreductase [Deltaproteobacteria bacterium]|nr:FAD-binding oxidoreductase [Deltaproteobacteria bacterium]MBN2688094.1 FAD-binding oxidoreductase [Deltaproteobacteria bacterium]